MVHVKSIYSLRIKKAVSAGGHKLSETTYLGFVKDITERKKIEKEVQESEERYRVLVKQMLDAIVISTIDGQILSVNENACTITGYSEKELLTKSIYDFVANDEVLIKPLQFEKLHLGLSVQSERKIVLNENKVLYAELNSKLLHDGTVLTIVRDITERKTAESLLVENEQFLLETQRIASIGTFSINLATDVWTRSKLLDVIFGTNSNDAFNSYSWLSLVHPDHKEIMIKYITEEVLEKKQAFNKEYKIIRANDGEERWLHGNGSLKLDNEGKPSVLVGTIRDVTERKLLEIELIKAKEKAEEAIAIINNQCFDIILMDIQMPIMNGYEAATEIRKIPKYQNVPIIALTAGILNGEREKCLEYGMNDYLSKPILAKDLQEMIQKWVLIKD